MDARVKPAHDGPSKLIDHSLMTIHLDSQADLEDAIRALVQQDPRLKPILERTGMPALRRREPGFAGLAAIITGQQLSTASAAAIWARVSAAFDPFDHASLRKARADRLGRLGLSAAKISTLKNLARELAAERLNLEVLANEDADAAHNTLTALHGIGPWTADVYLLFCLGHGDAWPAGDLAVQEAVKLGLGLKTRPTAKQMAPLAEPWRPLRGAAAHLWWSYYRVLRKREGAIAGGAKSEHCSKQAAGRKTVIGEGNNPGREKNGSEPMKSTAAENQVYQIRSMAAFRRIRATCFPCRTDPLSARPQTGIGLRQENAATRRRRETRMLDRTDDISLAADNWLAQFEQALAEPDGILLKTLFHADSYWRDVLALSWNLQTDQRRATRS